METKEFSREDYSPTLSQTRSTAELNTTPASVEA